MTRPSKLRSRSRSARIPRQAYAYDQPSAILVGEVGISVFRRIHGHNLLGAAVAFEDLARPAGAQPRNRGRQKDHAVNLLQQREVEWNQQLLGCLSVRKALDAIYDTVPSVRKKITAQPTGVELFGAKSAPIKPVCITFDTDSTAKLRDERMGIIVALEEAADLEPGSFQHLRQSRPHLSLGRVNTKIASAGLLEDITNGVQALLPATIVLGSATLHRGDRD